MPNKNGFILLKPTSVNVTGSSPTATINANGSVSFTNASNISLNGVFSSDYHNYRVLFSGKWSVNNGSGTWYMRLRSGGVTDATASSYNTQYLYVYSSGISSSRGASSQAGSITFESYNRFTNILDFYAPFIAAPTAYRIYAQESSPVLQDTVGTHNIASSYDGFNVFGGSPSVDMISGRIAVYGFRK